MKKEIQPHKILVKIVVTFTQEMTEHFDISLSWKSRTITGFNSESQPKSHSTLICCQCQELRESGIMGSVNQTLGCERIE